MVWQFDPYAIPLFVAAGILISFMLVAARRRADLSLNLFLILISEVALLLIAHGMELISKHPDQILIWIKAQYPFSQTIPVIWLLFVLVYTRRAHWITPRRVAGLLAIPLLHTVLAATNEYHHLNWTETNFDVVNGLVRASYPHGPMFYVGMAYCYGILLIALGLLVTSIRSAPLIFRGRLMPLLVASLIPFLTDALSLLTIVRVPHLPLAHYGLALTCMPVAWSLFRYRLFDVVPDAYDSIVQSMSDAVIVLNMNDQVIDANPAAKKLMGRPTIDLIGTMAQKSFTGVIDEITPLLRSWESTGEITHPEGDMLYTYDVRISPLRNARNHFTGRVIVIRDSTERKRSEETIRRYALELEERNRDLDSFSDTVAHDLRAPLHLVIGYAGLLLDLDANSLPPHLVNYIKEMQHAGYKMNEMVQGLLVLARLRDVRGEAMSIPAGPVIRSALTRFRDRIQMRGIQIEIDPNLPPALAHGTWLEEIFANLIGNAITYIGQENAAPCIEIRGSQVDHIVRYEVHDNGLGLTREMQQSLFEAFTRFHREEGEGLGMGLSIVQRIVTRLNGTVGVESEPGQGSTFWFTLPAPPDNQSRNTDANSHPLAKDA